MRSVYFNPSDEIDLVLPPSRGAMRLLSLSYGHIPNSIVASSKYDFMLFEFNYQGGNSSGDNRFVEVRLDDVNIVMIDATKRVVRVRVGICPYDLHIANTARLIEEMASRKNIDNDRMHLIMISRLIVKYAYLLFRPGQ